MEEKIIAAEMRHSVEAVITLTIVLNKQTLPPQKQVSKWQVKCSDPPSCKPLYYTTHMTGDL